MWDADSLEIKARLEREGSFFGERPMEYSGHPSLFQTSLSLDQPGNYLLHVFAFDPSNGNCGLDQTTFRLD